MAAALRQHAGRHVIIPSDYQARGGAPQTACQSSYCLGSIRLCRRLSPRFSSRTRSITAGEGADSKIVQQPIAALTTLEPLPSIEKFVPQRLPYTRPQHAAGPHSDQGSMRGSFDRSGSWEGAPMWLQTPTTRRLCTGACVSISLMLGRLQANANLEHWYSHCNACRPVQWRTSWPAQTIGAGSVSERRAAVQRLHAMLFGGTSAADRAAMEVPASAIAGEGCLHARLRNFSRLSA